MCMEQHEQIGTSWFDPDFRPSPPEAPYFDTTCGAWILSRYTDVVAALRESALHLSSPRGETFPDGENEMERSRQFAQVRAEIASMGTDKWRTETRNIADRVICDAIGKQRIDLLGDITQPWCVGILLAMSGADQLYAERISDIAACLHYKGAPSATSLRMRPPVRFPLTCRSPFKFDAEAQLDQMLERKELVLSKPMFHAVSHTLPSFLAKSWLALLRNPAQALRLRKEPNLIAGAVDELVRYAGIVHTLYRKAHSDVAVAGIRVAKGELLALKVASANFDPARFSDPYQLDLARKPAGQLGLGSGLHACIGAAMVRYAFAVLTPPFLNAGLILDHNQDIVWLGESTLRRPLAVYVKLSGLSQSQGLRPQNAVNEGEPISEN